MARYRKDKVKRGVSFELGKTKHAEKPTVREVEMRYGREKRICWANKEKGGSHVSRPDKRGVEEG